MSAVATKERDLAKEAKVNLLLQAVLALPFLALFGFTLLNVAVTAIFLVFAAIRVAYPLNETIRRVEFNAAMVILVVWVLAQVV